MAIRHAADGALTLKTNLTGSETHRDGEESGRRCEMRAKYDHEFRMFYCSHGST
jgi:hypothetical protein